MLKLFSKDDSFMLPNGSSITGSDLMSKPGYSILGTNDCVVCLNDGILVSYQTLSSFAETYGIEYSTEDGSNPSDVFAQALEAKEEMESNSQNEPAAALMRASVKVAQISAMSFTDEQALEVKDIYPEFETDHQYKKGDFFTYRGELYKVNQDHTSAEQWEPGSVGTESLYTHLTLNESGYPIWQKPTGAHDAYNKDEIVEFEGELYKSLIDGNVYSPTEYPAGWEKYTEPEA